MSNPPAGVTAACCEPPAVIRSRDDYELKGSYKPYGIFEKAYITGPEDTDKAIIFIYDIFGYFKTTQQGADILGQTVRAKVIMPDFSHGKPYDSNRYLNPPEGVNVVGEVVKEFFDPSYMQQRLDEIKAVAEELRKEGKTFVGCHGLCWGGRLAVNAGSLEPKVVDAASTNHPAQLTVEDAQKLQVPVALYPSKDDPADVAQKIYDQTKAKAFGGASDLKVYSDMHHGWSGAHAWLDRDDNYAQFGDVYNRLAKFYIKASEGVAA